MSLTHPPALEAERAAPPACSASPLEWLARMKDALDRCADCGCRRVAIYGAGTHTRMIVSLLSDPPVEVAAVIDDGPAAGGRLFHIPIIGRDQALRLALDAVILSSNTRENELWLASAPLRETGAQVVRLYDDPAPMSRPPGEAAASLRADSAPLDTGFHGDQNLIRIVDRAVQGVERFIETGSNLGNTLRFTARRFPFLRCLSCEPDSASWAVAAARAAELPNASVRCAASPGFLHDLLREEPDLPSRSCLFYLDAHGYGFRWPLADELALISRRFPAALVLIDDLLVPGRPQFKFDRYGGQVCSLEALRGSIAPGVRARVMYPAYQERTSAVHPLVGWGLLALGRELPDPPDDLRPLVEIREARP